MSDLTDEELTGWYDGGNPIMQRMVAEIRRHRQTAPGAVRLSEEERESLEFALGRCQVGRNRDAPLPVRAVATIRRMLVHGGSFTPPSDPQNIALRNCLALARSKLRRADCKGGWEDVVRFCASAGVEPRILRALDGDRLLSATPAPTLTVGEEDVERVAMVLRWNFVNLIAAYSLTDTSVYLWGRTMKAEREDWLRVARAAIAAGLDPSRLPAGEPARPCARRACEASATSGPHRDTGDRYCVPCARKINDAADLELVPLLPAGEP